MVSEVSTFDNKQVAALEANKGLKLIRRKQIWKAEYFNHERGKSSMVLRGVKNSFQTNTTHSSLVAPIAFIDQ